MMVSWLLWFLWMIFVVGDVDDFVVCLLGGGVWMINIGLPMSNLYICEFNLGHNKKNANPWQESGLDFTAVIAQIMLVQKPWICPRNIRGVRAKSLPCFALKPIP